MPKGLFPVGGYQLTVYKKGEKSMGVSFEDLDIWKNRAGYQFVFMNY